MRRLSLQYIGLGFSLIFKGCGPLPACSNHNQMDGHNFATEVACWLQTNNTVLLLFLLLLLLL